MAREQAHPLMHGMHPFYKCWIGILYRCDDPNCSLYWRYRGRGITVSDDWRDFANFHRDMFPTWEKGLEIDRINNDDNYYRDNCHWVTIKENTRNRSTTLMTLEKAEKAREMMKTMKIPAVARHFGVARTTMNDIKHGRTWV